MVSDKQKTSRYERLVKQAEELLLKSPSLESGFATLNALLYHKVPYIFWVGFYLLREDQLIVNAYQGPLACQILPYPKGICWQCVIEKKTILVPDVSLVSNHVACDARSRSEIVTPVYDKDGNIIGVLDVDSDRINAFSRADQKGLEALVQLLS